MILITYIKPFVIINSNKLISGKINIIDSNNNIALTEIFNNSSYFNIKVNNEYGDDFLVVLKTQNIEVKKRITIKAKPI